MKDRIKKLVAKGRALLTDMEDLRGKVAVAEDDKKVGLQTLYESKQGEFKFVEDEVLAAKADIERAKVITDAEAILKAEEDKDTDPDGKGGLDLSAQPRDIQADEKAKILHFRDFIAGKEVPGAARAAMKPTSGKLQSQKGMVVPRAIAAMMLDDTLWAKLMISTDAGDASLIPPEWKRQLLQLPMPGPTFLNQVTMIPVTTGQNVTWPYLVQNDANEFGQVVQQWIGEGAEKPETEPEFGDVAINTFELACYTETTIRFENRSAFNIAALLSQLFRAAAIYELERVIAVGTGVAQPLGFLNTAGIRTVPRTNPNQVVYADLVHLKHAIRSYHRQAMRYLMHDEVEEHLELQVDTTNRPLFRESVQAGPYDRLIGYPYNVNYQFPNLGSAGDIALANLAYYFLAMEQDIVIDMSEHYKFRDNRKAYRMSMVVGGRQMQPRAVATLDEDS